MRCLGMAVIGALALLTAGCRCNRDAPGAADDSSIDGAASAASSSSSSSAASESESDAARGALAASRDGGAAGGAGAGKPAATAPDIRRVDDTHYEVRRSVRDALVGDLDRLGAGVRAVPNIPSGVRILTLAPGSTAARLGLRQGDVVESVEGVALPGGAVAARARARSANPLHVALKRGGAPIVIVYGIVE